MSNKEKASQPEEQLVADTQSAEVEKTEEVAEESSVIEILTAEAEALRIKNEKLNRDLLLSMADFDNFRKRTLREKADLIKLGGESCLEKLLPVIDDFERGLQAIGESSDVEAVKEGMVLIYNKFKQYLEQHGVKEIPTADIPFDTEFHEAITTFPAPLPEKKGHVIDTVQKGYTLNDKVIRFAKVVVGE